LPRTARSPGLYRVAEAAEPSNYLNEARQITQERVDELELENRSLRRKLFLNGIALPPESRKSLANTSTRLSNYNSSGANTPSRSRPRTAASLSSGRPAGEKLTGIIKYLPSIKSKQLKSTEAASQKQVYFSTD
jgi:hypothetical protein